MSFFIVFLGHTYLCANYFAKCATNLFCNMNAIGITLFGTHISLIVREANYQQKLPYQQPSYMAI